MAKPQDRWETLSDRERQVAVLASMGMSDRQIAAETSVSINTIRTYWTRLKVKLQRSDRAGVIELTVVKRDSEKAGQRLERYRQLSERYGIATLVRHEDEWRFKTVGFGYANLLSKTAESLLGKPYRSIFSGTQWTFISNKLEQAVANGFSFSPAAISGPNGEPPGVVLFTYESSAEGEFMSVVRIPGIRPDMLPKKPDVN